jgi:hypothetical protein
VVVTRAPRGSVWERTVDRIERVARAHSKTVVSSWPTQPNEASNGLHRALGFLPAGTYRGIGWKAGARHDVQWWQLDLRPSEPGPPSEGISVRIPPAAAPGRCERARVRADR